MAGDRAALANGAALSSPFELEPCSRGRGNSQIWLQGRTAAVLLEILGLKPPHLETS